jgi:hypothetical protein
MTIDPALTRYAVEDMVEIAISRTGHRPAARYASRGSTPRPVRTT